MCVCLRFRLHCIVTIFSSVSLNVSVCLSVSLSVCVCLSVCPSVCLSVSLSVYVCLFVCLSVSLSVCVCLSVCLFVCLSVSLSVYVCLSVCLSVSLSVYVCLFVCLSVSLSVCVCLCTYVSGNLESLKHYPQSRKIDIYKSLQKFRLKYYLPQYMTLAVQSQGMSDMLLTPSLLLMLIFNGLLAALILPSALEASIKT